MPHMIEAAEDGSLLVPPGAAGLRQRIVDELDWLRGH
jgi:hypothetical protein